jgi:hypothetical protein
MTVESDFSKRPDWGFLFEKGWWTIGGGPVGVGVHLWKPGKISGEPSASLVESKDGIALLHCFTTNGEPFEHKKNYNAFDAYRLLMHGGDADAACADLRRQGYGRETIPLITSKELSSNVYRLEYLIKEMLVRKQPCIVAGPKKALKTSILIALAIALAMGLPFLGHFTVARPCRVLILSGESGMATMQETARRICASIGISLADCDNLLWSDWLPRFDNPNHLDSLEETLQQTECEVLIVDPAYLCMPGTDASNLFIQGTLLQRISEVCQRKGVGLILAHHTRKQGKGNANYEPPELDDMAWAGFAEFARQWFLIGRREQYEPGTGEHRLWLSVGGSAGHSGLYGLDIDEGTAPRHWSVDVLTPDEARKEKKADNIRRRLIDAASNFPDGECKTAIIQTAGLRGDAKTLIVFDALVADKTLIECEITRNHRLYEAFKLA